MFNTISRSQLFVLDQDQAKDFYVETLGLECSADIDLGFMRWLTVAVPGDPGREILLEGPAELVTDATLPVSIALGPANRAKYPQYYSGDDAPPFRPFWCLRPRRVYAWSLSEFPARATRFDLG